MEKILVLIIYLIGCYVSYKYLKQFISKWLKIDLQYDGITMFSVIIASWLGVMAIIITKVLLHNLNDIKN